MSDHVPIFWTSYEPLDGPLPGKLHDGVVREWHDEEGWGVIDCAETPGGCWTHFSAIVSAGFRQLTVGSSVAFTAQPAQQDGFTYRATRVFPLPHAVDHPLATDKPAAYHSTLTITRDGEPIDPEVVLRETRDTARRARLDVLEAIVLAGDRRSEVLSAISETDDSDEACAAIGELLDISAAGAAAVLDMQLRRFSREELQGLRSQRDELREIFKQ